MALEYYQYIFKLYHYTRYKPCYFEIYIFDQIPQHGGRHEWQ